MKDLYFTSSNPKHTYKSEQFFSQFFRLRKTANFGSRVFLSNHKKFLVLKKFFQWYYFVPTRRFFVKLFSRFFQRKKATFRYLATFFYVLESNLLVLLVRTQFAANMYQAFSLVKAGLVSVNGFFVTRNFYSLAIGDIVECLTDFAYSVILIFWRRYLVFKAYRLRYFQGAGNTNLYYTLRSLKGRIFTHQAYKTVVDNKHRWLEPRFCRYFKNQLV